MSGSKLALGAVRGHVLQLTQQQHASLSKELAVPVMGDQGRAEQANRLAPGAAGALLGLSAKVGTTSELSMRDMLALSSPSSELDKDEL